MRLSVALSGSSMSQPFADISVTNSGRRACVLTGYPRVAVVGFRAWPDKPAPSMRLRIAVHHGIYERVDPGPHRLVLQPLHDVFFSIGTATAYQGGLHPITMNRLSVILPRTHTPKTLAINLMATRPPGRKIPVGITALTASPRP